MRNPRSTKTRRPLLAALLVGSLAVGVTAVLPTGVSSAAPPAKAKAKAGVGTSVANYMIKTWADPDDATCGAACFSVHYDTVPATPWSKFWEYTNSVPMLGIWKLYERTGDRAYFDYVKAYVDRYVDANGVIALNGVAPTVQDVVQPSQLLFGLYRETKDQRYLTAMTATRRSIDTIKANPGGAFFHKPNYANQQWLDGLYMTEPFLAQYSRQIGDAGTPGSAAAGYAIATKQIKLALENTFDEKKSLPYHGWNGAPDGVWAGLNGVKGKTPPMTDITVSPVLWSRSIAWAFVGMVDTLEYLPKSDPAYDEIVDWLSKVADGLERTQDSSGLWYQVTDVRNDKLPANGGYPGENVPAQPNFLETSASALIAYGFAKAARLNLLDDGADAVARKAWKGVQSKVVVNGGSVVVKDTVVGMSLGGTYNAYTNVDRRTDLTTGELPAPPAQCANLPLPKPGTSAPLECKFSYVRDNVPQGIGAVLLAASELEYRAKR